MGTNGNGNGYHHGEPIDYREPWEILDGCRYDETALHSARRDAIGLINDFASSLESVLARPDCTVNEIKVRFFALCASMGLNCMLGRSFTELADELQVSKSILSRIACEFCTSHDLSPSFMMKAQDTRASYQAARIDSIKRSNGQPRNGAPRGEGFPVPPRHRSV